MLFKSLLFASTATASCLHGLSKFKRAEPAEGEGEVAISTFGYTGLLAPLNWASLDPANEACATGKNQSPINIDETITAATDKPVIDIPEQEVEFENLGSTIEVVMNGTTKVGSTDFRLRQFHIHTPSEHRISEEFYPLEVHMVHEGVTDPNQIAVVALMFQMSTEPSDAILAGLVPHLAAIATPGTKTPIQGLDLSNVVSHVQQSEILQYTGSLTTPPCAEGITFMIAKDPLPIDVNTFNEIKKVVKFNSRFTQNALGGENMAQVGAVAGTANAILPGQQPGAVTNGTAANATHPAPTAVAAEEAPANPAGPTKGQTLTITEIAGEPTQILGVVIKGKY